MLTVDLDFTELRALRARANRVLGEACVRLVTVAAKEGADEAIRVHQYRDRTGALTRSISGRYLSSQMGADGAEATGEIVANATYASFVDGGTEPHEIRPKFDAVGPVRRGQSRRSSDDVGTHRIALRWIGGDGAVHFARVVHHPGSKPYPFMGPAYLRAERVMEREFEVIAAEFAAQESE